MLSKGHFKKTDAEVSNMVAKTKKPCFFVRSHIDRDMDNFLQEEDLEKDSSTKEEAK